MLVKSSSSFGWFVEKNCLWGEENCLGQTLLSRAFNAHVLGDVWVFFFFLNDDNYCSKHSWFLNVIVQIENGNGEHHW